MNVVVGTHLFFGHGTDAFLLQLSEQDVVLKFFSFELRAFSKHVNWRKFLGISVSIIRHMDRVLG